MRILVTGGTGYIGSCLVKRLVSGGHDVGVVVLAGTGTEALSACISSVRTYPYDGTLQSLREALNAFDPECVIHVASLFLVRHAVEDVDRLVTSNILFPAQLLEVMSQKGVKHLINVGTSWQHFLDAPYNPVNLYAATKQAFLDMQEYYIQACGLTSITLKLFDTYGPGDSRPKLFTLLRRTALTGVPLKMSPGRQVLNLVYIDDIIDAFLLALERVMKIGGSECYGVFGDEPITLQDLVRLYAEVIDRPLPIVWGGLPYRPREVMAPWQGGVRMRGWKARVSLRQGMERMEQDVSIGGLLVGKD